jgi:streptomycin 6-kinase
MLYNIYVREKVYSPNSLHYRWEIMAAMDREDWRKLLKKARAHTGLSSQ